MPKTSPKKAKLETLPQGPHIEALREILQRNQDYLWDRLNYLEERLAKLENGE